MQLDTATAPPPSASTQKQFDWPLAYEAEELLRQRVGAFLERNSFARQISDQMRNETGTDFFEWIDHMVLRAGEETALRKVGFVPVEGVDVHGGEAVFSHPRATLPCVRLQFGVPPSGGEALGNTAHPANADAFANADTLPAKAGTPYSEDRSVSLPSVIALRPERVADFKARQNLGGEIEGAPQSRYRRLLVSEENGCRLEAVERRAYRGYTPAPLKAGELEAILKIRELWKTRRRAFPQDSPGFEFANRLLDQSIPLIGRDLTCQIFFEEERAYWESRNRAGRFQKFRQDSLGLGWGNHDHHTFRCSREHFVDLIEILLKLGFEKRERYYAGAEAGWGAQILEQATTGIVVFADVDLMPDETQIDFSISRLPPAPRLGTVGLWVGLHGESFLNAGMHHLEARFDYQLLREQLKAEGVNTMNPFSNFEFLRQAFTEGERWPVQRARAERLLAANLITVEQFEKFTKEGAIGSHLENLQRHGGFKGFNQKSVSVVIAATDPRKSHFESAQPRLAETAA
jgi:hypothetical protein